MTPTKRQKQLQLEERMQRFASVYNAAWHVRYHMSGHNEAVRLAAVRRFWTVLLEEARDCKDPEALLYAVADSITSNPLGLPWER